MQIGNSKVSLRGICILLLPFWSLSNFLCGSLKQSCGRELWVEGMGLGWFPCVQPKPISWHPFLIYFAQICLLPPLSLHDLPPVSLSHLLQPDFTPGARGTVFPGGLMRPHQSPLRKEGNGIPGRSRGQTPVSVLCPSLCP